MLKPTFHDRHATVAWADIKDYEFQLIDRGIKAGSDGIISVRTHQQDDGRGSSRCCHFAVRLDMAPEGMQEMLGMDYIPVYKGEQQRIRTEEELPACRINYALGQATKNPPKRCALGKRNSRPARYLVSIPPSYSFREVKSMQQATSSSKA